MPPAFCDALFFHWLPPCWPSTVIESVRVIIVLGRVKLAKNKEAKGEKKNQKKSRSFFLFAVSRVAFLLGQNLFLCRVFLFLLSIDSLYPYTRSEALRFGTLDQPFIHTSYVYSLCLIFHPARSSSLPTMMTQTR